MTKRRDILASKTGAAVLLAAAVGFVGACSKHSSLNAGRGGASGATTDDDTAAGGTGPAIGSGGMVDTGGGSAASGGASGSIGTGTDGAACGPKCSTVSTCEPSVIAGGLVSLTDFSTNLDSRNMFHTGSVDDWTSLFGGTWVAPRAADPCAATPAAHPLLETFTDGNWHITGTIAGGQWAGAGIWFGTSCPVMDFSAYQGISFTIAGDAGPSGAITVSVSTASNSKPNTDSSSSNYTCYSNAAACTTATCTPASMTVSNISATPQTVRVLWSALGNGMPSATPDPKEITGIGINPSIDWSSSASSYALDLTIDDLALIP